MEVHDVRDGRGCCYIIQLFVVHCTGFLAVVKIIFQPLWSGIQRTFDQREHWIRIQETGQAKRDLARTH